MEKIKVRITLLEEMLGTSPTDPEIYKTYIGKNAPDAPSLQEEIEAIGVDEVVANKLTIFPRDEYGNPILFGNGYA